MKKALIFSYSKNVGHLAHVVAYYRLFEAIGFKSTVCVENTTQAYLPNDIDIYDKRDDNSDVSVALFYSSSLRNFLKILYFRLKKNCKVLYVFHEPMPSVLSYYRSGFSIKKVIFYFFEDLYERLCVLVSRHIILSSNNAIDNYKKGGYKKYNSSFFYIPLLFEDKCHLYKECKREYFSYIGTVAVDHAFNDFLEFVKSAVIEDKLRPLKFLIATSSEFEVPRQIQNSDRVKIIKGHYLTDEEIDRCYAETSVIWNAYNRMTQSGVLARAFMFGTPAIVLRRNLTEFTNDGQEVVAMGTNTSFEDINKAVTKILSNFDSYSNAARQRFENSFYYMKFKDTMRKIISNDND